MGALSPDDQRRGPRRLNIVHLAHSPQRRGAETFAAQLVSALQGQANNWMFCLYRASAPSASLERSAECLDGTADGLVHKLLRMDWSLARELVRRVAALDPDVIVAHGGKPLLYGALLKRRLRQPRLVYRTVSVSSYWAKGFVRPKLYGRFLRGVDRVICTGQVCRDDFLRVYSYPGARVSAIDNGVDVSPFLRLNREASRSAWRDALGIQRDDIVLANVASCTAEKNQQALVDLVEQLHQRGWPVHSVIVGDGPLRQLLMAKARSLAMDKHVHCIGASDSVPEILAAGDIFVLSSHTETMNAAVMEAGLAGLPSVAFAVGGVPEVIEPGRTGLLVPHGDARGLADAVQALCADPRRRKDLAEAARSRYCARFSMEVVAQQYLRVFQSLVAADGTTAPVKAALG